MNDYINTSSGFPEPWILSTTTGGATSWHEYSKVYPGSTTSTWPVYTNDLYRDLSAWRDENEGIYIEGTFYKKEEFPNMISSESKKGYFEVCCSDENDLSEEKILKSLSIMKYKLERDSASRPIKRLECWVTPKVKENIIKAGKRIAMYGKRMPFVARYSEYGEKLPDEIHIDSSKGILFKVINPEEVGELYLSILAFYKN